MVALTIRLELKFGKLKYDNLHIWYKNVKVKVHPSTDTETVQAVWPIGGIEDIALLFLDHGIISVEG